MTAHQPAKDERRDARVERRGFTTLRIPAETVFRDLNGAITAIVALCAARAASTTALSRGGPPPRSGEGL